MSHKRYSGVLSPKDLVKSNRRPAMKTLRRIRKICKGKGWGLQQQTSSTLTMFITISSRIRLVTSFDVNRAGFGYMQSIHIKGDEELKLYSSYLSYFGSGGFTTFSDYSTYTPEEVSEFVVVEAEKLIAMVRAFVSSTN